MNREILCNYISSNGDNVIKLIVVSLKTNTNKNFRRY